MTDIFDRAQDLILGQLDQIQAARLERAQREAAHVVVGEVFCQGCGDEIPPRRLAAVPTAIRCVWCESGAERARGVRG